MAYIITAVLVTIAIVSAIILAIHAGFRAPRRLEQGSPSDYGLNYESIRIPGKSGKQLFSWWLPAAEPSSRAIVLLHGWGGNAELMLPLALPLHDAGLNVLLLDARNHGHSDPAGHSSLPRFAEDVGCAVDWLKTQRREEAVKTALLGHSVGAGAVLYEASRRHDIAAVISIAAFAHPEWMMRRVLGRLHLPEIVTVWILRYVEWIIGHRLDDIAPRRSACLIDCPVLLVHGKADDTVPVTDALAIHEHCRKASVELLLIEDAGHESVDKVEEHGSQLVAFLLRAGVIATRRA